MALKVFLQVRGYFEDCTVSDLYDPEGNKIGYALEDVARPPNVKIYGKTCIPEALYNVNITYSNKYKKEMIQLWNTTEDLAVNKNGIKFTGIRVHGGNTVDDSEGCPLIAEHFDGDDTIWKSLSAKVTQQVKDYIAEGHTVKWCIISA